MQNIAEMLFIKSSCTTLLAMFVIIFKEGNKIFFIFSFLVFLALLLNTI